MTMEPPISSFAAWPKMIPTDFPGGPRGQLAVHPAAAQFLLDNAASSLGPGGINAVDEILNMLPEDRGAAAHRYPHCKLRKMRKTSENQLFPDHSSGKPWIFKVYVMLISSPEGK